MTKRQGFRAIVGGGLVLAWAGVICRGLDSWLIPALVFYATPWLPRLMAGLLALFTYGSTMLGVRGKILSHESLGVHDLFRCHRVRVALPDHGEMTVVVADVRS
jgi:hypothetical protein